ncbi:M24 family metallopeptidase [Paracoccus cavernae]|uniref:M24 family metallopeptidase n=1 Tax=Paracoccus cavernae TaxID=1571207 RepID=UPI0035F331E7
MVHGVGGANAQEVLAGLKVMTDGLEMIGPDDLRARLALAQAMMRAQGIAALYLDATVNQRYFTGLNIGASERLHGALLPAAGDLVYLSPAFEGPKTETMLKLPGRIALWQEHEDPGALVVAELARAGIASGRVAVDPQTPFFTLDAMQKAGPALEFVNGAGVTAACRSLKSEREIALMQRASDMAILVHKSAASILYEGISTTEVQEFILAAYGRLGGDVTGSGLPIVLFGEATAYPHGVDYPQTLKDGDMVLVDTGCKLDGYRSDITRTYVFGTGTARQREVWNLERTAQLAGFDAARLGAACENVDHAARAVIEAASGFASDYGVPGLPHRTGHGIGLDMHEDSYMVRGNLRPLEVGMCFSVEPMICIYGEFGIRLEDCAYMTDAGARWFTEPAHSFDDPFGITAGR